MGSGGNNNQMLNPRGKRSKEQRRLHMPTKKNGNGTETLRETRKSMKIRKTQSKDVEHGYGE
jgi:hypothetical protein